MTDPATAERLASLQQRRDRTSPGRRGRPAEASRFLAAGAGTAAVLTMVTAMAQADRAAEVTVAQVVTPVVVTQPVPAAAGPTFPDVTQATAPAPAQVVQTITVARPVRAQVSNGRTNASR